VCFVFFNMLNVSTSDAVALRASRPDDSPSQYPTQQQLMFKPDILLGSPVFLDKIFFRLDENDTMLVWHQKKRKNILLTDYVKEKHSNHIILGLQWYFHQQEVYILYQKKDHAE